MRARLGEEEVVDLLDEVVAGLVEAVNGVFNGGDGGVGGLRAAGVIFLVPEVEVGVMVGENESGEGVGTRIGQVRGGLVAVPAIRDLVLHPEDRVDFEHKWFWQEPAFNNVPKCASWVLAVVEGGP